jgi:POT family proton-dependent oligopeptide transporter
MLAGLVVFWKGINANVLGDKGLQPDEYIGKKVAGLSITNLIYTLGFIAVPIFGYLIILDTQSEILGNVLTIVGLLVIAYVGYIIYDFKVIQKDQQSGDRLIAIMILAVFCTIFWACFEQAGSSITVWVDKCVNLVGMNASQTNAINPFYIVLLAIPFSWMWTKLGFLNKNPNTPMKFALGIFQLGVGFLIFASTAHFIGDNGKVPFLFVFVGYLLITTGELFLSPIGLSKVTELAPKKIAAFMMGVWFLSSTFAHYISGVIAKLTTSENENIESNWLSELSNWFMGNPDTSNEAIATLLQYNSVYAQIGFVTIFIALFVVIISPFIKKLMHGIH